MKLFLGLTFALSMNMASAQSIKLDSAMELRECMIAQKKELKQMSSALLEAATKYGNKSTAAKERNESRNSLRKFFSGAYYVVWDVAADNPVTAYGKEDLYTRRKADMKLDAKAASEISNLIRDDLSELDLYISALEEDLSYNDNRIPETMVRTNARIDKRFSSYLGYAAKDMSFKLMSCKPLAIELRDL